MMKAIRIHANGGPEVLRWEDHTVPPPGPGEVRIRHTAIAVNYSDVNVRRGGFYIANPLQFPVVIGNEAAGIVESVGPGVTTVRPGDRIAYVGSGGPFYENTGAYAEQRNLPASCLIRLPAGVSDRQAAAMMLKGLTASMIVNRIHRPKPGETILIHAAASGVGLILTQWAKHLGATVIGTVGSAEKARVVAAHGCDHPILYRETDFVAAVKRLTGAGVHAVFDGVGKDTFIPSLDCVRPFGMLVNYGNASGHVPPLDLLLLAKKGSLSVSRPAVSSFQADEAACQAACDELFDLVARGIIKVELGRTYRLEDAATAHRDLEARQGAGSMVLIP
ncbi:MAG: Quinone oxidoreductase [Rhodospirillales bacterium]|nr:Quinone oxidoreductase [Rhodospirillales bacterium]